MDFAIYVMEYCPNGDLEHLCTRRGKLDEDTARDYLKQIGRFRVCFVDF